MLVAFIVIYCCGLGAFRYVKRLVWGPAGDEAEEEEKKGVAVLIPDYPGRAVVQRDDLLKKTTITFVPQVYVQRYVTVVDVLRIRAQTTLIKKVVDFGCSDMSFFHFLKETREIEEIICVDIDKEVLQRFSGRIMPTSADYLKMRTTPLTVTAMRGSIVDFDRRLKDTNAIVAIELIEHLFPDTLEELPYSIFGVIQPCTAIFTTPNADFNVVFPNFSGFRNDDHKFEWSRQQFEDWAVNLTVRYPDYEVGFNGIGRGPEGTEQYGCCSQIAVFCRKTNASPKVDKASELQEVYDVVRNVEYPVYIETRTEEEIIRCDAEHYLRVHHLNDKYSVDDRIEIPINEVIKFVPNSCTSPHMLREILTDAGWKVELGRDKDYAVILPPYGLDSDNDSNSDMSDRDNANYEVNWTSDREEEENWDTSEDEDKEEFVRKESSDPSSQLDRDTQLPCSSVPPKEAESNDDNKSGVMFNGHKCDSVSSYSSSKVAIDLATQDPEIFCAGKNISGDCASVVTVRRRSFERPNKNKNFRHSLCCDEGKSSSGCDIVSGENLAGSEEEIASAEGSKAGDSGYPNSSERDMDMDLTPEQVDEIVTESESSFEEEGDDEESIQGEDGGERPHHNQQVRVHWMDNMENGDVANNNRDWEGNNMEAEAQIGEPLQFEHVIDRRDDFALPLMDAAAQQHLDLESDEDNRYVSACEFLNTSDDTIVASEDSFRQEETFFLDDEEGIGAVGGFVPLAFNPPQNAQESDIGFPEWLLNILLEDCEEATEDGAGDVLAENDLEEELIAEDVEDEEEVVATVNGDLMGGGEPSSHN